MKTLGFLMVMFIYSNEGPMPVVTTGPHPTIEACEGAYVATREHGTKTGMLTGSWDRTYFLCTPAQVSQ